jgi:hypothetical protein
MAARRLLLLMLVLLAVSSLAAALISPQSERDQGTETGTGRTGTAGGDDQRAPAGRLVRKAIDADARRPRAIRIRRGDELALTVRSRPVVQVEIPAFGLLEDAGRDDPALFDLLVDRRGRFDVTTLEPRRVIGTIVAGPPREPRRRRGR